jgi:hypothetical protein
MVAHIPQNYSNYLVSAGKAGKDIALSYKKTSPIMRICEVFVEELNRAHAKER